jgi:hypothetical protein
MFSYILAWVVSPVKLIPTTKKVAQIVGNGDSVVFLKLTGCAYGIEPSAFLMMAISVIGTLPEFNPEEQDTASYLEKVELFFEANNIAEEKKVAVFLTAAGQKTYEILRHHSAPKLPREKSFDEIVTLFKQHFHHSPAHHQLKADYFAQVPENQTDASKSTDSAQSQPSGEKVNYSDRT